MLLYMQSDARELMPWVQIALDQARMIVEHLQRGDPSPDFVFMHALSVLEAADTGGRDWMAEELPPV